MSDDASPAPDETSERTSAHGVLNLAGTRVEFDLTVSRAAVGPASVLPILQDLWSVIEGDLVEGVEREGRRVSCKAGCGACCRQLVPISRIEARQIAELVERLPEPRRSEVRARFAEAVRRLDQAGLLEMLRRPERFRNEDRLPLGIDYFRLGIPCPFLEQESCSIHADRPLACREYLVTSPAENCAKPTPETIDGVEMPLRLSHVLRRFGEPIEPGTTSWVPLILAPEWAEAHPDRTPARPGPEWVTLLFEELTGAQLPEPPGPA